MSAPTLAQLERWMQSVITHPEGVRPGSEAEEARSACDIELEDIVAPSATLPAEERIGVYARMYLDRLIEVLSDEFPAFSAFVGAVDARRAFVEYVTQRPSVHYSLNELGAGFPAFVAEQAGFVTEHGFSTDLATLERSLQESFDAPPADPIGVDELLAVPPDEWGGIALELTPSLILLEQNYALEPWYRAFRKGGVPEVPPPTPSWTAVYRVEYRVWRASLSYEQFALLGHLRSGRTLADALTHLSEDLAADTAAVATGVQAWFREWAGEGLFCGLTR